MAGCLRCTVCLSEVSAAEGGKGKQRRYRRQQSRTEKPTLQPLPVTATGTPVQTRSSPLRQSPRRQPPPSTPVRSQAQTCPLPSGTPHPPYFYSYLKKTPKLNISTSTAPHLKPLASPETFALVSNAQRGRPQVRPQRRRRRWDPEIIGMVCT